MAKAVAPKLRFPEFSDEWERTKIGDALRVGSGRDYKHLKPGTVPVFGTGGYMLSVDKPLYSGKSVLIGRKGTIDKPFYYEGDFWTVDTLFYTHEFKGSDPKYISYVFEKINWQKHNEASGVPSLSKSTIEKIKINLPSISEQEKIADFLTAVDNRISAMQEKVELLKKYKKGVMQKIFSQEIRFRDEKGNDYPDWMEKKLKDLSYITTGKLDANAMLEGGKYRFYTCAKEYYMIDKYEFDTEALLISGNGANVGYIHYYKGKFNAYQRTYVLDGFRENIIYIKHYLDKFLRRRIFTEKNEGNTPYIVLPTLANMKINLPTVAEQQKIADFLTSIDDKIQLEERRLAEAKKFKKSLLQLMFV